MKKILGASIVLSIVGFYTVGYSATVGNTATVLGAAGRFSLGLEVDKTERDLDFDGGSRTVRINGLVTSTGPFLNLGPSESIADVEIESTRIFLKGTVAAASWLDLFLKLGYANADLKYKLKAPGFLDSKTKFNGDDDLAYGIGAKAQIGNWGGWRIMADAQYLRYEVDGDLSVDGIDIASLLEFQVLSGILAAGSFHAEAEVNERQFSLYVAKTFGIWTPYSGLKYSDLEVNFKTKATTVFGGATAVVTNKASFEASDNVGLFAGTDVQLFGLPNLTANLEIRFIDEVSGSLGFSRHF